MLRRCLLLLSLAACLSANSEKDTWNVVRSLADALSAGDLPAFLDSFDRSMPDYDRLRRNLVGLLAQGEVGCNIEVTSNDGDETERTLTLDWIMTLEPKEVSPGMKRWEKTGKCRMKKSGSKWKIVYFEPVDLFLAPVG
ncbi:MAG TPA: hypothetical protein VMB03_09255 [Bryobacteraceae bacterium]|nr:hypothetical protein [Bryobacteraceae bacterium]